MNILYISPYYSTFIHNPICELSKLRKINAMTYFPKNLYLYFRKANYRKNYTYSKLTNEIPSVHQKQFFYLGLPQDINSHKYPLQIFKKISKSINIAEFDLIHAHTIFPIGVAAMYLAQKYQKPYIVTTHGMDFYRCFPKGHVVSRGLPYKPKEMELVSSVMESANQVICVSPKFASDVEAEFPKARITVLENSYDKKLFKPDDKQEIRKKLALPTDRKIILSVGNFIKEKGHIFLIEALGILVNNYPDILLILIGEGELKEKYLDLIRKKKLSNNFMNFAKMSQQKLAKFYQAADIFVMPSINESFGLTLVEAMACGLPAVAADAQGPNQIIDDNKNGYLVEKSNSKAIAIKIDKLLSDRELCQYMSMQAITSMKRKYGGKDTELLSLYKQILELG